MWCKIGTVALLQSPTSGLILVGSYSYSGVGSYSYSGWAHTHIQGGLILIPRVGSYSYPGRGGLILILREGSYSYPGWAHTHTQGAVGSQ